MNEKDKKKEENKTNKKKSVSSNSTKLEKKPSAKKTTKEVATTTSTTTNSNKAKNSTKSKQVKETVSESSKNTKGTKKQENKNSSVATKEVAKKTSKKGTADKTSKSKKETATKKKNVNTESEKEKKASKAKTGKESKASKKKVKKELVQEIVTDKETEEGKKSEKEKTEKTKKNSLLKKPSMFFKGIKEKRAAKKLEKSKEKISNPEKKKKTILTVSLILIFIAILSISSYNIYKWCDASKRTKEQMNKIKDMVEITEKEDNENTQVIEPEEPLNLENPYWDFINMNLMEVDFSKLKEINDQTIGWIKVPGTNVNYPFVHTSDNDYYLFHSFDKSYNDAGWVFMDFRNSISEMHKNTVLYAHGRYDNTMFGSLRHILNNGWLDDSNNFVIMLSTDYENTLWQVVSAYTIPSTNDYIRTEFDSDEAFMNFVNMIVGRSHYNFNTPVSPEDKLLTLSTCYDDYSKMVIHAKLIKKEAK